VYSWAGANCDQSRVKALREENHQFKRALEELSILNDLVRAIGALLDSEDIAEKIVRRSIQAVDVKRSPSTP
jgi:hypothetical protein